MQPNHDLCRQACVRAFTFTYTTSHHYVDLFPDVAEASKLREANRLLEAMERQGLIRRFSQPSIRGKRGGSAPKVVTIDRAGASIVAEEVGLHIRYIRWKTSPSEQHFWFINHTLAIADYAAILRECVPDGLTWIGETLLRRDPLTVTLPGPSGDGKQPAVEESYSLVPDGLYTIEAQSRSHYFLELDRGTMVIGKQTRPQKRSIAKKILAYQEGIATQLYERQFFLKTPPRVTFVTTDTGRMRNMQQAVEEVVADEQIRSLFWLTTLDAVTPSSVLSKPIWHVAGREGTYALLRKRGEDEDASEHAGS